MSERPRPLGRGCVSGEHSIAGHGEVVGGIALLEDAEGTIAMGLVAESVAYLCFVGRVSEDLATWCARRLTRLLDRGCHTVFLDVHAVEGGLVAVRSAIMDALFSRSRCIPRVVSLVPAPVAFVAAPVATAVPRFTPIVTAIPADFDAMLVDAAPQAHATITLSNCRRVAPSTRPPLRVVRSA